MNKLNYFLIALLFSASAFAGGTSSRRAQLQEQARQSLGTCQARVNQLEQQIKQKERKIQALQNRLSRIQGQPEYAEDIERHNGAIRSAISERDQLVQQRSAANQELNQNLNRWGRRVHINYNEGQCAVVDPSEYNYKDVRTRY